MRFAAELTQFKFKKLTTAMALALSLALAAILITAITSTRAWAMEVIKVRNQKVLIKLGGEVASKGQIYQILNASGQKKGVAKIIKIKGDRAIGRMSRQSEAQIGWSLQLESSPDSADGPMQSERGYSNDNDNDNSNKRPMKKGYSKRMISIIKSLRNPVGFGAMGGLNSVEMEVSGIGSSESDLVGRTTKMDGRSWGLLGFIDYNLTRAFWLRAFAGVEDIKVESDDEFCHNGNDSQTEFTDNCFASIRYANIGFTARAALDNLFLRPWVGAGGSLYIPFSKSSSAILESSLSIVSGVTVSAGVDIGLKRGLALPIQFDYNLVSSSDTVKTKSFYSLKAGIRLGF